MNSSPIVSVLMTAYNREKYIADAIESVLSSVYENWELIILDDCSNDNTITIARKFESKDKRIRIFKNENNLGQFNNRNKIVGYAKGKYIKYLDSDDLLYPHCLDAMVSAMEKFPDAGIGLSFNNYNDKKPLPLVFSPKQTIETHFFNKGLLYIGPSAAIYNRNYFNELGGFKDFGVASDYEFNLRASLNKSIVLFYRDLIWWRSHSEQEFVLKEKEYLFQNERIHYSLINSPVFPLSMKKTKEIDINYNNNFSC